MLVILSHSHLGEIKGSILKGIMRSKFTQVKAARMVLLTTKDAQLWHGTRGILKALQVTLEEIRKA
jgi:hypothetical protein